MADPAHRKRIVIVGAGFGGLSAAKVLGGAAADVTLIDRTNHHLFQPLLYQVATAALSPADIATASRVLLRRQPNTTVLMADVTGVDTQCQRVHLASGADVPYDYLILANGAAYSFFGHDAWAGNTQVLKTLDDALSIRERLLGAFERAEVCDDPELIRRLLTFVVVGGGPTGVELAGTIAELTRSTLARDFKHIDTTSARVLLLEAGSRVLSAFPQHLSDYAAGALRDLGVELRLNEAVSNIDETSLQVGDTRIEAATILWCAGTEARPAAKWLGAAAARNGAVRVTANCSVIGHPMIFAIGDVASFDPGTGQPLPGLAPVAKQQGHYVGKLIKARLAGSAEPGPFRYRNLGAMAIIGRSHAIADFGTFRLTGFVAWLAWSLVHLMLLVDIRSRLLVYVNWSWAFFTYGRGARLLTGAGYPRNVPVTSPVTAPPPG
ncbi:MAG TPA: NAD(P)/FAD-dependent oxidoreductase [Acetobacteraceae bacterium]|jgi:NADH dehydrogenase